MQKRSSEEIISVNKLRESLGLKTIKKEKRACLKCDVSFFSSSSRLCKMCRHIINRENYGEEFSFRVDVFGDKLYD